MNTLPAPYCTVADLSAYTGLSDGAHSFSIGCFRRHDLDLRSEAFDLDQLSDRACDLWRGIRALQESGPMRLRGEWR